VDPTFSAATRRANLAAMENGTADILIIGGGITGAGIARDAAMRGLQVALVECGDFGHGTSGASSRLIHGGLRYLEHGWFKLVFEASRERRTLLRIAPHLVRPRAFTFPVHKGSRVRRWQISAGVLLYDLLALFRNAQQHRWLSRKGVLRLEPLLRDQDLAGGAEYWDAQCDDARLVLAVIRSAHRHGAQLASYTRVHALEKAGGRVRGALLEDVLTGRRFTARAHVVVNATGPWTDGLRRLDDPDARPLLRPTKGAHIVVPQARIGNTGAVTLLSPVDGRVMFVLPWGRMTVVGTTDTDSVESPDTVRADATDVAYLLRSANAVFPNARLSTADVVATWAGLRPLLAAPGRAVAVPREHEIHESAAGLITIAGGKLTTFRVMAAQTVNVAARRLSKLDGRKVPRSAPTDLEPLPGGDIADYRQLATELEKEGLPRDVAMHLVATYGSEAAAVANVVAADGTLAAPLIPGEPWIKAEVIYQARREMALTVSDVLVRRTRLFHHHPTHGVDAAGVVARLLAGELRWTADDAAASLRAFEAEVAWMRGGFSATDAPDE
jgi:glycerol-3-phosphate dehydrogenase